MGKRTPPSWEHIVPTNFIKSDQRVLQFLLKRNRKNQLKYFDYLSHILLFPSNPSVVSTICKQIDDSALPLAAIRGFRIINSFGFICPENEKIKFPSSLFFFLFLPLIRPASQLPREIKGRSGRCTLIIMMNSFLPLMIIETEHKENEILYCMR